MCTYVRNSVRAIKCSANRFGVICLCGRRADAEAARSDGGVVGRGQPPTHQLFGARPIKRSLYDSAMRARRRTNAATNAEYCVSTRENRAAVHCGRNAMLSAPIAFSGACRWNLWFSTSYSWINQPFVRSRWMSRSVSRAWRFNFKCVSSDKQKSVYIIHWSSRYLES